ncbi:CotY/CotZ family spore coat protein [Jeotgalibacillus sp. ET6]|uniref:CotY/CotZ family spore coat protein n=1 Tax=Jeotgalibacillus sp. ET6 TaxID=3037260 RepID=UPI0024181E29|nr:CotY/CotZ family spore coat protein [Jeotgalibacillus sp. ET6]MDG5473011.1 CotY/CotZ family spore coat protein [Jeotgalibacillus sp. ET6]
MSCCGKKDNVSGFEGCVCEVVRAIKDIQDNAVEEECQPCLTSCFLEPLGDLTSPSRRRPADTRVFILKTKDGSPFHAFYRDGDRFDHDCISIYFRVESIFDNCCATLRVLEPKDKEGDEVDLLSDCGSKINLKKLCKVYDFESTDSCITVDLNCFCAVQCIKDVFLGICD